MPKKIDPTVRGRCVRQVLEHLAEYPCQSAPVSLMAVRAAFSSTMVALRA
jgi:transposase